MSSPTSSWWQPVEGGVEFAVRVVPNARKSEVVGVVDGILKVRLAKPPVDGQANEELARVLGKWSEVRASAVSIEAGHTSRIKRIRLRGVHSLPDA